jgi:hypothetical protein
MKNVKTRTIAVKLDTLFQSLGWDTVQSMEFDNWLFRHAPHIRMKVIGDETPMVWFSLSRCNPAPQSEEMQALQQCIRMNALAMEAHRRYLKASRLSA